MIKAAPLFPTLFLLCLTWNAFGASTDDFVHRTHHQNGDFIVYRLFIPAGYDPARRYPIVLTLHGAGDRGTDNNAQLNNNLVSPWITDALQTSDPCFVLAPQCPGNAQWVSTSWSNPTYQISQVPISRPLAMVANLLDSLQREFSLDTTRFYVSGLSMGGCGTWDIITRFPNRFAAAAPVCGVGDSSSAASLQHTAIWAFHGTLDPIVPVNGSRYPLAAIEARGNPIVRYTSHTDGSNSSLSQAALSTSVRGGAPHIFTEYTNGDHFVWGSAFADSLLPVWMFSKTKTAPPATPVTSPNGGETATPLAAQQNQPLAIEGNHGAVRISLPSGQAWILDFSDSAGRILRTETGAGAKRLQVEEASGILFAILRYEGRVVKKEVSAIR